MVQGRAASTYALCKRSGYSLNGSVTSATICAVLGTLLVLAVRKSHSKLRKVVEAIGLLPEMLPGIVLVIGIMLFWNQIYNILPLYNTMGIMVLAYVVLFLPYTVQYVTSSFTQISDSLMAAGQVFGGSPVYIPAADPAGHRHRLDDDLHHRFPGTGNGKSDRSAQHTGGLHLYRAGI